jgi:hypothetical protein
MASQVYGNGANSSQGANTIVHFYDRAGIKAANRVKEIYTVVTDTNLKCLTSGQVECRQSGLTM